MQSTYETLSIISFSLALLFLVLSLYLFLKFDIRTIIGELSGRTARKTIEKIIASSEAAAVKEKESSPIFLPRGRISEAIGKLTDNKKSNGISRRLTSNKAAVYTAGTNITEDLPDENSTDILQETPQEETMATELLTNDKEVERTPVEIKLIEEIIIVHTKDVIE